MKIFRALAPALMMALWLGACSTTGVLNTVEPKAGRSVTRDIAFQPGPRGGLDVYQPRRVTGPTPVVVFFYGGSWNAGSKGGYGFVGEALAAKGILVIIPDYRVYPQAHFPDFLQDNALAVRWARDHAAEYGGDPHRLFVMGHSAGAYDAAMLALDPRWLAAVGMDPARDLRGMIGLAGPYDFLPLDDETRPIFGLESDLPATQPINHVTGHAPRLFLATDATDKVVEPGNTQRLADKARDAGLVVEQHTYHRIGHTLLIGAFAAPLLWLAPVRDDVARFILERRRSHAAGAPVGKTPATRLN